VVDKGLLHREGAPGMGSGILPEVW
jgi:hypothetical protein